MNTVAIAHVAPRRLKLGKGKSEDGMFDSAGTCCVSKSISQYKSEVSLLLARGALIGNTDGQGTK